MTDEHFESPRRGRPPTVDVTKGRIHYRHYRRASLAGTEAVLGGGDATPSATGAMGTGKGRPAAAVVSDDRPRLVGEATKIVARSTVSC